MRASRLPLGSWITGAPSTSPTAPPARSTSVVPCLRAREDDRRVPQRRVARRSLASPGALPRVRPEMMVVAARAQERGVGTELRHEGEAEGVAVERDGRRDLRDAKVHVAHDGARRQPVERSRSQDRPAPTEDRRCRAATTSCAATPARPRARVGGRRRSRSRGGRGRGGRAPRSRSDRTSRRAARGLAPRARASARGLRARARAARSGRGRRSRRPVSLPAPRRARAGPPRPCRAPRVPLRAHAQTSPMSRS